MREALLHHVWQHRNFMHQDLLTNDGEPIEIIHPGYLNHHDGPDFLNAKIKIGNAIWNGNVEIHVKGKDWYQHKHHTDTNYTNVILHVVYYESEDVTNIGGHTIPTLSLGSRIPFHLIKKHRNLMQNNSIIACSDHIQDIDEFLINSWKERLLVERLEQKVVHFEEVIARKTNNWEAAFFYVLAENFGLHANKEGFSALANSIDFKVLQKHHRNLFQLEALLFGQSGMLNRNFEEEYPNKLKDEYLYLKNKYSLEPLQFQIWKLKGLRPISFPTVRIALLAALLHKNIPLFSTFQDADSPKDLLLSATVSDYWNQHYTFNKISSKIEKRIAEDFANTLLINAYIPMLFAYGKFTTSHDLSLYAMEMMEELKPEINRKTKLWRLAGVDANNAADSQALIQSINSYCSEKRCLECRIGYHILNSGMKPPPEKKIEEASYIYN